MIDHAQAVLVPNTDSTIGSVHKNVVCNTTNMNGHRHHIAVPSTPAAGVCNTNVFFFVTWLGEETPPQALKSVLSLQTEIFIIAFQYPKFWAIPLELYCHTPPSSLPEKVHSEWKRKLMCCLIQQEQAMKNRSRSIRWYWIPLWLVFKMNSPILELCPETKIWWYCWVPCSSVFHDMDHPLGTAY